MTSGQDPARSQSASRVADDRDEPTAAEVLASDDNPIMVEVELGHLVVGADVDSADGYPGAGSKPAA